MKERSYLLWPAHSLLSNLFRSSFRSTFLSWSCHVIFLRPPTLPRSISTRDLRLRRTHNSARPPWPTCCRSRNSCCSYVSFRATAWFPSGNGAVLRAGFGLRRSSPAAFLGISSTGGGGGVGRKLRISGRGGIGSSSMRRGRSSSCSRHEESKIRNQEKRRS